MVTASPDLADLRRELDEFKDRYPNLHDDELFVLWFLRAFVADDDSSVVTALCGGSSDKGVDAVLIDEPNKIVFVIQGKYRRKISATAEHRGDVTGFARLAVDLCADGPTFASFTKDLSPEVSHRLKDARARIKNRGYTVHLYYVTLGKCSDALRSEATRIVRSADGTATFELFDGKRILLLLADYLDGVAPPVPSLDLEIESGGGVRTAGVLNRYDSKTDIESWVFSMTDVAVAGLYERAGIRLFARNVRGFLGSTEINRGMEATLESEPDYFWYYNNGVTIVCDDASQESSRGRNILRVANPQVINGQQTTRTLARSIANRPGASVLVRVIRVPRSAERGGNDFETLVSRIVSATNWQNAIRPSDLMSNDRRQIEIERQLRKLHYLYLRKRMTKREARRSAGARHLRVVKKEEFAQAVAACDLDPSIVRAGREQLFEERLYSQVFPSADPDYYLTRYWLLRKVTYAARGSRERVYAKWLVLNLAWQHLAPLCRKRSQATAFRQACERDSAAVVVPLLRAVDQIFLAALRFYRANRGSGATAVDVSTFFKRRNLEKEFARFWRNSSNTGRGRFDSAWAKFHKALDEEVSG
jgi:hypothetical protein